MTSQAKKRWREFLDQSETMHCMCCPVTFVEKTTDLSAYSETECPDLFLYFVEHSCIQDKEILLHYLKNFFDNCDDGFSCTYENGHHILELCKLYQYVKEDMEIE